MTHPKSQGALGRVEQELLLNFDVSFNLFPLYCDAFFFKNINLFI